MDDLDCKFQGQLRSKVKTDLNSQHMVSYLLPIQTMALSVTVFEIFSILVCMRNPIPTPNFGVLVQNTQNPNVFDKYNPHTALANANPSLWSHVGIWHG